MTSLPKRCLTVVADASFLTFQQYSSGLVAYLKVTQSQLRFGFGLPDRQPMRVFYEVYFHHGDALKAGIVEKPMTDHILDDLLASMPGHRILHATDAPEVFSCAINLLQELYSSALPVANFGKPSKERSLPKFCGNIKSVLTNETPGRDFVVLSETSRVASINNALRASVEAPTMGVTKTVSTFHPTGITGCFLGQQGTIYLFLNVDGLNVVIGLPALNNNQLSIGYATHLPGLKRTTYVLSMCHFNVLRYKNACVDSNSYIINHSLPYHTYFFMVETDVLNFSMPKLDPVHKARAFKSLKISGLDFDNSEMFKRFYFLQCLPDMNLVQVLIDQYNYYSLGTAVTRCSIQVDRHMAEDSTRADESTHNTDHVGSPHTRRSRAQSTTEGYVNSAGIVMLGPREQKDITNTILDHVNACLGHKKIITGVSCLLQQYVPVIYYPEYSNFPVTSPTAASPSQPPSTQDVAGTAAAATAAAAAGPGTGAGTGAGAASKAPRADKAGSLNDQAYADTINFTLKALRMPTPYSIFNMNPYITEAIPLKKISANCCKTALLTVNLINVLSDQTMPEATEVTRIVSYLPPLKNSVKSDVSNYLVVTNIPERILGVIINKAYRDNNITGVFTNTDKKGLNLSEMATNVKKLIFAKIYNSVISTLNCNFLICLTGPIACGKTSIVDSFMTDLNSENGLEDSFLSIERVEKYLGGNFYHPFAVDYEDLLLSIAKARLRACQNGTLFTLFEGGLSVYDPSILSMEERALVLHLFANQSTVHFRKYQKGIRGNTGIPQFLKQIWPCYTWYRDVILNTAKKGVCILDYDTTKSTLESTMEWVYNVTANIVEHQSSTM